jgi:hypothetical protein
MFLTAAIKTILFGANKKPSLDFKYAETPQIDPRISWARNITATVVDHEGLVKTAKANEARLTGARRVENLITYTEDLTNAAWIKGNTAITTGVTDPFGNPKAFTLTSSAISGYCASTGTTLPIATYTLVTSLWIRRRTGTGSINLQVGTLTYGNIAAKLTSSWQLLSFTGLMTYTNTSLKLQFGVPGDEIDIYHPLVENVTGQANQNPSNYKSVGVLSYPYHGAGVDGVAYENTTNGNTVTANVVTEAAGTPLTGITLLAEEARTNLLVNPTTPATQNITTTAQTYTVSMCGTGTCILTGTATGTLTGTGANNRVQLTVTPTAGTLTLTFAGTNTNGQFEAGSTMSSFIPNNTARAADVPSITGTNLTSWYNPQQGTFVIKASGQGFRSPSPFGAFNLTLPTSGTYVLVYNNTVKDGSVYLYTLAGGSTPTEYTGISVPTTISLLQSGLVNLSSVKYYPKALKPPKIAGFLT